MDSNKYIFRLHRVEGQLRGIEKMLNEGRDIISIVQQIDAAKTSLAKLITKILVDDVLVSSEYIKEIPSEGLGYIKKYLERA